MYHCISIDPPWLERGGGKIKRGADRHYQLLKTPEIIEVIKAADLYKPADDCHLWLWVTDNFLEDGLTVIKALGFRYIRQMIWVKDRPGLGQYMRGLHEPCLFAVRGGAMVPEPQNRPPSAFYAPKTRHSEKPLEAYRRIEMVSPGPRLEMFARTRRHGWDSWGLEVPEEEPVFNF